MRICRIEGCNNLHMARGLCQNHYNKVWRRARSINKFSYLPHKTANILAREGIFTREDLRNTTIKELMVMKGLGVIRIEEVLVEIGLKKPCQMDHFKAARKLIYQCGYEVREAKS